MNKLSRAFGLGARAVLVGGALLVGATTALAGDGFACDVRWTPSVDQPFDMVVDGEVVYVLNYLDGSGLEVYDFGAGGDLELIGSVSIAGESRKLVVEGARGYVSKRNSDVIDILDLSDPMAPVVVGSYQGSRVISGFDVEDDLLYIPLSIGSDPIQGLEIVDVSDPAFPVILGVAELSGLPWSLDVVDGVGYIELLESEPTWRIEIVDLRKPLSPVVLGSHPIDERFRPFVVEGSLMYVDGGLGGIQIVDVSLPETPVILSEVDVDGQGGIEIVGDTMYAIGTNKVTRVDLSNLAASVVGEVYESPGNFVTGAAEVGGGVLVSDLSTGLHFVDFDGGCDRPCVLDMNRDEVFDFFDVTLFIRHKPDLNTDRFFDFRDISFFLSHSTFGCN